MAGKQLLVEIPDDLRIDLDSFREANLGATKARVVREALRQYIDNRIAAEPDLRARYYEARNRLIGRADAPIRLIKPREKPE
jgi:metal-responsive CopG/Arc/MetJ family transcriptional regulator